MKSLENMTISRQGMAALLKSLSPTSCCYGFNLSFSSKDGIDFVAAIAELVLFLPEQQLTPPGLHLSCRSLRCPSCGFFRRLSGAAFSKAEAGGQAFATPRVNPLPSCGVLGLPAQPCVPSCNLVITPLQGEGFPPWLLHVQQHLSPL